MENLKVKVNSIEESKEIQELFFELGFGWHGKGKKVSYSEKILGYGFGWLVLWKPDYLVDKVIQIGTGFESVKEITIQELRDMVVLKRNDCKDRTHVDSNNYDWYVASDEKHYRHQGSIWVHQPYVSCLELKPISEKPHNETEYLLQGKNGEHLLESIEQLKAADNVNHPSHYCSHPSGIECIEITRHHDFAIGNAIKYLWRAGLKDSDNEVQDLEKAIFYIKDKIKQLKSKNVDDKTIDWIDEDNK